MDIRKILAFVIFCLSVPVTAYAHPSIYVAEGFSHGALHPLTGLDHLVPMFLVGVLAIQIGSRAVWLLPLSFLLSAGAGWILGVAQFAFPLVEAGIALSAIVLGAFILCKARFPFITTFAIVGVFGLFHGHAHGTEMPGNVNGLAYAAGFLVTTVALHLAGLTIGFALTRPRLRGGSACLDLIGGIAVFSGLGFLMG